MSTASDKPKAITIDGRTLAVSAETLDSYIHDPAFRAEWCRGVRAYHADRAREAQHAADTASEGYRAGYDAAGGGL